MVENNNFYQEVLQAYAVRLSHVILVGYGGGFGGDWDRGGWLPGILQARGAEVFLADGEELGPEVLPKPVLRTFRKMAPDQWGHRHDV